MSKRSFRKKLKIKDWIPALIFFFGPAAIASTLIAFYPESQAYITIFGIIALILGVCYFFDGEDELLVVLLLGIQLLVVSGLFYFFSPIAISTQTPVSGIIITNETECN